MSYDQNTWNQLKGLTSQDLIAALLRDGWIQEVTKGAVQAFRQELNGKTVRRVTIHVHPKKTYGASLLKGLLADIGWTEADMKRVKLIR